MTRPLSHRVHVLKEARDFVEAEHFGQRARLLRMRDRRDDLRSLQRHLIEELERGQVHPMTRRTELAHRDQMQEKLADVLGAELRRRSPEMRHELARPEQVAALGVERQTPQHEVGLHLVVELEVK